MKALAEISKNQPRGQLAKASADGGFAQAGWHRSVGTSDKINL